MWIQAVIFLICVGIFLFLKRKGMEKNSMILVFVIIFAGNLAGGCVTVYQFLNQERVKKEYLIRNPYGQGNYQEELKVRISGEDEKKVDITVPEQEGEPNVQTTDPVEKKQKLSKEEQWMQNIQNAVEEANKESGTSEKFYLPKQIDGKQVRWSGKITPVGTVLAILSVVIGVLLILRQKEQNKRADEARMVQMMLDYPDIISKMLLFLGAGMPIRRTFGEIALEYQREKRNRSKNIRYAYEEILCTYHEMESGVSELEAYEHFSRRCCLPRYKTFAALLSQNVQKGSSGLVQLLEREAIIAFDERKRKARILGEQAATKLLLPMVLMLLVVLVILMVPAFLSFY